MDTATTPPAYLPTDDYAGRYVVSNLKAGHFAAGLTAAELAAESATGVVWTSFGTPRGMTREHFSRNRYVAAPDGSLHLYASNGQLVIIHPADRVLRVVRRTA